jgi:hypothetical protein
MNFNDKIPGLGNNPGNQKKMGMKKNWFYWEKWEKREKYLIFVSSSIS